MPMYLRSSSFALTNVVPVPAKGSKTIPPTGQPAIIGLLINSVLKVA